MSLFNLGSGVNYTILVHEGDDPGIIINRDIANPVYLGSHPGFNLISEANILDPLTYVQYSGDADVYGVCGPGLRAIVDVQYNNQNWAPGPIQSAQALIASGLMLDATGQTLIGSTNGVPGGIFSTGVPLVHKSTVILNQTTNCPANATTPISGIISFTQHSFELRLNLTWPVANGIVGVVVIRINWIDSTTGLITAQDEYASIVASTGDTTGFFTRISGPTKADQAQFFINNLEAAAGRTVSAQALVLANSRALTEDSLDVPRLTQFSSTVAGAVGASGDSRYLLGSVNTNLAAAATDTWLCTPGVGPIWLNVWESGVAGSNINARLRMHPNTYYSNSPSGAWLINDILVTGAPNKMNASLFQAGGPMIFQITNNGSVAASYSVAITRGQALA